jgi:hypothetical protein
MPHGGGRLRTSGELIVPSVGARLPFPEFSPPRHSDDQRIVAEGIAPPSLAGRRFPGLWPRGFSDGHVTLRRTHIAEHASFPDGEGTIPQASSTALHQIALENPRGPI